MLTTFGRSDYNNNIYLNIRDLTPATYGHCIPEKSGNGHKLFKYNIIPKLFSNVAFSPKVSELMWKDLYKNYDLKSRLINYKGHCVIIRPRQDVIPGDAAYEIRELIPQAKIVVIERSGHYPQIENPEAFYPALKKVFLDIQ